jgi:hypothetical protein
MMTESTNGDVHSERDSTTARKSLDRHGHGFHYAVLKALRAVSPRWRVEAVEFPVEINDIHLHIDIVLRSVPAVMAIECKRVNPSLGAWCFARSGQVSTNAYQPSVVSFERVFIPEGALAHHGVMVARDTEPMTTEHQYHVCQELKTGEKGDIAGGGRSAIDDALTQAIRGASGLATAYAAVEKPAELMAPRKGLYVIPAIITSARLLVLTTDLADADLATGRLPDTVRVEERPWVWFRVMTSSNMRHKVTRLRQRPEQFRHSLGDVADREYARSVAIVSVGGLAEFLQVATNHVGGDFL